MLTFLIVLDMPFFLRTSLFFWIRFVFNLLEVMCRMNLKTVLVPFSFVSLNLFPFLDALASLDFTLVSERVSRSFELK